jgi:hypothetical protein
VLACCHVLLLSLFLFIRFGMNNLIQGINPIQLPWKSYIKGKNPVNSVIEYWYDKKELIYWRDFLYYIVINSMF